MFISPHRVILKTCGTTLNLHSLPHILEIAYSAGFSAVYRCFYSRKSFVFPELQVGPHRKWTEEIEFLDRIFMNGAAYTLGRQNGDHWMLYVAGPEKTASSAFRDESLINFWDGPPVREHKGHPSLPYDFTIEILMTELSPEARAKFSPNNDPVNPTEAALQLSSTVAISKIFPPHATTFDAYLFSPCGYSSNAIVRWEDDVRDDFVRSEGYFTIHVTPEDECSYASFECNVPLGMRPSAAAPNAIPDLKTVIQRVVSIFQPGKLILTLFISTEEYNNQDENEGETLAEAAQRAFKAALCTRSSRFDFATDGSIYKRTDKISHSFGDYELAFASFEIIT
jgi:S-adenosylmethionine decarboxylase